MSALAKGSSAPRFELPDLSGGRYTFDGTRNVVLAFFKISCPTCQYTFPFLERLYQNKVKGHESAIELVGISQDDAASTRDFIGRYGITFPVLLDEAPKYTVSNAYGLTNVPTLYLICGDGGVEWSSVGWSRDDMEDLNARISNLTDATPVPLFQPGDNVVQFKAG